jgi:hypothetical protein
MNVHKLVASLFEILEATSGRKLDPAVRAITPETFFPEPPPDEDQAGLEEAADSIAAEHLIAGSGPIGLLELADGVEAFGKTSASTWCPPLAKVLRDAADRV